MNENILIKYSSIDGDSGGFDLGLLGESFSGFGSVLKELIELSQIQAEVEIKTNRISEGSIEVFNLIQVAASQLPFNDIRHLLDFLEVTDPSRHSDAYNFFNSLEGAHRSVNDYFARNPLDTAIMAGLLGAFFTKLLDWSPKQKRQITTLSPEGDKISERYAKGLRQMIVNGKFKKALRPLTENNVSSVKVVALQYRAATTIDDQRLGDYLPDEEKILPDLENGSIHTFIGEIVALQSTRGEMLKVRIGDIDSRFNLLIAHPADGKQTENYKDFYKKQVRIVAEIYRKSLFEKPRLLIQEVQLLQAELFDEPELGDRQ